MAEQYKGLKAIGKKYLDGFDAIIGKDLTAADPTKVSPMDVYGAASSTDVNHYSNITATSDNYFSYLRKFVNSNEFREAVEAEINRGNRLDERYILSRETGKTNLNHIYKKEANGQDSSTAFDLGNSNYRQSTYTATVQNLGDPNFGATATETNTQGTKTGEGLMPRQF